MKISASSRECFKYEAKTQNFSVLICLPLFNLLRFVHIPDFCNNTKINTHTICGTVHVSRVYQQAKVLKINENKNF
jgi:hypothetical protein